MNKSVPTLLGIVIILLVVVLVVLIYDFKLTSQVAKGGMVVQTTGGRALTGVEGGGEQVSPSEVLGASTSMAEPMPEEKAAKATRVGDPDDPEGARTTGPRASERLGDD